jgi:hypothetical protein
MPRHPLAEVFGFRPDDFSTDAERHRQYRLCPFNNRVPNCTKDKANDPLGVCSVLESSGDIAITCPVRFRQNWSIAVDAARFFFPSELAWTSLTEIRLNDRHGSSAGNIDVVLVAYDDLGRLVDFGALEVQAVYVSGNIRRPFEYYMADPTSRHTMDWSKQVNYPRPDYLSSSRKRLAPQLIYKGGILHSWKKKQAVALHRSFFETLPDLDEVPQHEADMAWLIYDLVTAPEGQQYQLSLLRTVYTQFKPALDRITMAEPGPVESFMEHLQSRLDNVLDGEQNPPDAPTLDQLL